MFGRKEIVHRHIDRLLTHSTHGDEHLLMRYSNNKKVGCVDGRQTNNKSDIGSLIGGEKRREEKKRKKDLFFLKWKFAEKQLENLLSDNATNAVSIVFHTCCGYLITAMTLHRLFKALKCGIDPSDGITLARVIIFIDMLMKKPWINRGKNLFKELMTHVDLSKVIPLLVFNSFLRRK